MAGAIHQHAFTSVCAVREGEHDRLDRYLRSKRAQAAAAFSHVTTLHFGRLVVLPPDGAPEGTPHKLVLETNHDGELEPHLDELEREAGAFLQKALAHCQDFVAGKTDLSGWLKERSIPAAAYYQSHLGLTRGQIESDTRLRAEAESWLDAASKLPKDAVALREQLLEDLAAKAPSGGARWLGPIDRGLPTLFDKLLFGAATFATLGAVGILIAPLVRWHEIMEERAAAGTRDVEPEASSKREDVALHEDDAAQNGLTVLTPIKPGWFRHTTLRFALWVVDRLAQKVFVGGALAGLTTIHFARWCVLDDGRLLFLSNYDGSWESYLGDFVDHVAFWLTLIWSNTHGFPPAKFLGWRGARSEEHFKGWTRRHQLPNQLWFGAYPRLTVPNVLDHARLREGAAGAASTSEAREWLSLL